ncbi:MAG: hypothetical protein MZU84_04820 [Sphingobacterium sp.]|nr:hypothetical protein [Sphingobacterium sp.]
MDLERARARHAGLLRRRPREPGERGGAARGARYNQKVVAMADFEFAKDKVLMGAERQLADHQRRGEARSPPIHEAGHALRRRAPAERRPGAQGDDHPARHGARPHAAAARRREAQLLARSTSRTSIADPAWAAASPRRSSSASITTGAGNDLERATELARKMVCEWGMSDALGPLTFGKKEEQIFLGREIAQHQDYSEDTAVKIDGEVRRIVQENYTRAQALLTRAQGRAAEDCRRAADPRGARRRAGEGHRPG